MTKKKNIKENSHVSFSENLTYDDCPYKWYLSYIEKHRTEDSIHNTFGKIVHEAIDRRLKDGNEKSWITMGKKIFSWILDNPKADKWTAMKKGENKWLTSKGYLHPREWTKAALVIYSQVFDWLEKEFGEYELVGSEVRLEEPILEMNSEMSFKGFVDLAIKDKEGTYHVIDFKVTNWGWDLNKRRDTKKQYQITLYKKFLCQKLNIDPSLVKTHFVLLKRTPPKKTNQACELITISSGKKKAENAIGWVEKNVNSMKRGVIIKKRTNCKLCDYHKTELCP